MSVDAVLKVVKRKRDGENEPFRVIVDGATLRLKSLMCDDDLMCRFHYSIAPDGLEKILNEEDEDGNTDEFMCHVSWKIFNIRDWNIGSLVEHLNAKVDELRRKKFIYENMKTGLEYAKLSYEEKENVESENPAELLADAEDELVAVLFLDELADYLSDYAEDCWFCMALM